MDMSNRFAAPQMGSMRARMPMAPQFGRAGQMLPAQSAPQQPNPAPMGGKMNGKFASPQGQDLMQLVQGMMGPLLQYMEGSDNGMLSGKWAPMMRQNFERMGLNVPAPGASATPPAQPSAPAASAAAPASGPPMMPGMALQQALKAARPAATPTSVATGGSALDVPAWVAQRSGQPLPQFPGYTPLPPMTELSEDELRRMNKQPYVGGKIGGGHGGNKSMAMGLGMLGIPGYNPDKGKWEAEALLPWNALKHTSPLGLLF